MWIVFRKDTDEIVGMSAHAEHELGKEDAVRELVSGLIDKKELSLYDAFKVSDDGKAAEIHRSAAHRLSIKKGSKGDVVDIDTGKNFSMLQVSTDAKNKHVVDGIAEIPADGKSFCTISIQKIDSAGKPLKTDKDADALFLRTTAGTVMDSKGANQIRTINLVKGQASLRLYSEDKSRVAKLLIFNEDARLLDASISVEFV